MSQYLEAKKVLHASVPERLIGRLNEYDQVKKIIQSCFDEANTASLYVNGPPGTGKTVLINHVLDSLKEDYKFKQIPINW
jgi:archaeal cell division control protein 6